MPNLHTDFLRKYDISDHRFLELRYKTLQYPEYKEIIESKDKEHPLYDTAVYNSKAINKALNYACRDYPGAKPALLAIVTEQPKARKETEDYTASNFKYMRKLFFISLNRILHDWRRTELNNPQKLPAKLAEIEDLI